MYIGRDECFFGRQKPGGRYTVIGVPFDSTSSYRPGQRFAPCEIRRALYNIEWNSLFTENTLYDVDIDDLGDVSVVHGDSGSTLDRISSVVEDVFGEGRFPVVIGGEHLITYGVIKGLKNSGIDPCIIVLDAHFDLRNEYLGLKMSHATVMRRIHENLGVATIIHVGVRAWEKSEKEYADRKKFLYYTSMSVKRLGPLNISSLLVRETSKCKRIYLSIDMDVVDPGYAPGVANPEPLGLTPFEVVQIARSVAGSRNLVGIDLVEVSPPYDCGGITSILGAKILMEAVIANKSAFK